MPEPNCFSGGKLAKCRHPTEHERSRPVDESSEKSGEGGLHCNPADGRPDAAETGSIDQIRDIIFGSQMKAYERRFQRLEERSQQRFDELHAEVGKRLEAIEAFFRREIDGQSEQLKSERSARSEAVQTLSNEIDKALRALSASIEAQAQKQAHEAADLRQQLMDFSKSLSEEIRQKHDESARRLDQEVRELDGGKVARTALSEILLDMAVRLSDELAAKLGRAPAPSQT
jgi:uncharacterized FlaG/YvyC family protein